MSLVATNMIRESHGTAAGLESSRKIRLLNAVSRPATYRSPCEGEARARLRPGRG